MNLNLVKKIYFNALRIRRIENTIAQKYKKNQMRCPIHLSVGQELIAASVCAFLTKSDYVVSSHRSHAHYLSKGGSLNKMIAELYGKVTGCSLGRGGSMHLIDLDVNFMGATAIVGNTIPIGVGIGEAISLKEENGISVIFLGDGATEEGVFYESVNYAAVRNIPVLFVCENNDFSVYTNKNPRQSLKRENFRLVAEFGISSQVISDFDINSLDEIQLAIETVKRTRKPSFLEIKTFRVLEHCGPNNDDHLGYRTESEIKKGLLSDPLNQLEEFLVKADINFESERSLELAKIDSEIESAFEFAENSPFPETVNSISDVFKAKV